jgi:fructose-1,6-bisphosphatase/inositol monophosphatase family enzyme
MDWETAGVNCVQKALESLKGVRATKAFDDSINPHTDADLVSHNAMVAALEESGMACDLVSEEFGQTIKINGGGQTEVFIDPIDGTVHFMRGELSFCGTGMIVIEDGQPSYSFVGDIAVGDIYHCDREGSYKNDNRVKNPGNIIGKNVIAGWAPYGQRLGLFFDKVSKLTKDEFITFNFGQMLQSAKITDGRYDACFEIVPAKLKEFAGAIIAWRAGGTLTTMEGNPIVWDGSIRKTMLVSRDNELHQKLLKSFNS